MISIVLLIIYCIVLFIVFLFFDINLTILTIVSTFIGYLYAVKIEPWIDGTRLDIKELNKENKKLKGSSLASVAITTGFIFTTIVGVLLYIGNVLSSKVTDHIQAILIQTIVATLSLIIIPIAIIVIFFRINNRIKNIYNDDAKWEEVPNDRECSENS